MIQHSLYSEDYTGILEAGSTELDELIQSDDVLLAFDHLVELSDSLPLFKTIKQEEDIPALEKIADHYRQVFNDVIILGTGGSSLGGQAFLALRTTDLPRFHFQDNIDPYTFDLLISKMDPKKTGIIVISKSGNTPETLVQFLLCLQHWQKTIPDHNLKTHFTVITEPSKNTIRSIAQHHDLPCLDHHPEIGGRYAALTLVGLLPALIAGLDARAARRGARIVLDNVKKSQKPENCPGLFGAALSVALSEDAYSQSIFMPYIDRLAPLSLWYRQLWAESLGKDGQGTTPVPALGTVDQHSQLQLYLGGPKDKFFTVLTMDHPGGEKINCSEYDHPSLAIFQGKTMGDLMVAEQRATIDTLRHHECPTRVIHLKHLDEEVLGALMMHFILETLAASDILRVNPFDQPAVEEGKILTQKYLSTP